MPTRVWLVLRSGGAGDAPPLLYVGRWFAAGLGDLAD